MEHFVVADRFPGASPQEVLDWDEEMVKDALQLIAAENRYHIRERGREGSRIDARTGIPLE